MSDAANIIFGPLVRMKALVAASASFQTLVGHAANAALAAGHVYCPTIAGDFAAARPFALVDFGDAHDIIRNSTDTFSESGSAVVQFDVGFPSDATLVLTDPSDTVRENAGYEWFADLVGDILAEMVALSNGSGGYLNVMAIRQVVPPTRGAKEDVKTFGDYLFAAYSVGWR